MNSVEDAVENNGLKVEVDFKGGQDDLKSTPASNPASGEIIAWNFVSQETNSIVFDHEDVSDVQYLTGKPEVVTHDTNGDIVLNHSPRKRGETIPIQIVDECAWIPDSNTEAGIVHHVGMSDCHAAKMGIDMIKESDRGIHIVSPEDGLGRLGHIINRFPLTEEEIDNSAKEHNIQRRMPSGNAVDVTKFDGASQVDYLTIDSIGSAFDEEEITITPEDALKLQDELNVFEFMAKASPGFKRDIDFEKRMALNQLDLTDPEEIVKLQAYMQLVQKPMDIENLINKAAHDKMKKKSRGNKTRWRDIKKGR